MKAKLILILTLSAIGMLVLLSCRYENEKSDEPLYITVNFGLQGNSSTRGLSQDGASYAFSSAVTSLVVAVPASRTNVTCTNWNEAEYHDAQLADKSAQTVTLKVPLNESIRLAKLDYGSELTIEQLKTNSYSAADLGISEPFTVDTGTINLTIAIDMASIVPSSDWPVVAGTTTTEHAHGLAIDSSGNLYTAGHTDTTWGGQTHAGSTDFYFARYSASGALSMVRMLGSAQSDNGTDLAIDSAGNIYVTGHTSSESTFGGTSVDFSPQLFLAKYTTGGTWEFVNLIGSSATTFNEFKRLYIRPSTQTIYLLDDANGIRSFNTAGTQIDATSAVYPNFDNTYDHASGIYVEDSSGSVYVTYNDYDGVGHIVRHYSDLSAISWDITVDAMTYSKMNVNGDSSHNLYYIGTVGSSSLPVDGQSCPGDGGSNEVLIKQYNSSMVRQWTRLLCTTGADMGIYIAVEPSTGYIYTTGGTDATLDGQTHKGLRDVFVASYTSDGTFRWHRQFGGTGYEHGEEIVFDSNGNIYVGGSTDSPTFEGKSNTNPGDEDVFILKLDSLGNLL